MWTCFPGFVVFSIFLTLLLSTHECYCQSGTSFVPYSSQMIISDLDNETTPTPTFDPPNFTYLWNDPTVIVGESGGGTGDWVMWLTRNVDNGTLPPQSAVQPYIATSSDGIEWSIQNDQPVFPAPANRSGIAGIASDTPSVRYFNGLYHMFTASIPNNTGIAPNLEPFPWYVGHWTSNTGDVGDWTEQPLLFTNLTGGYNLTAAEPAALVLNDTLMAYFVGVDFPNFQYSIFVCTSTDGQTFSAPQLALSMANSTDYPRSEGWLGPSTPTAIILGGQVHLYHGMFRFFPEDGSTREVAVTHSVCTSSDGISGWITDPWPPLFQTTDFYWSQSEIRAGEIVEVGDQLYLYLAGDTLGTDESSPPYLFYGGIGLAVSPNPFYEAQSDDIDDSGAASLASWCSYVL